MKIKNLKLKIPAKQYGFSVVEVMLAVALFMIFATGMVGAVLHGLDNNRLSGEQTIANQYAAEGVEAARSIRNQTYANLVNSSGTGVVITGGVWTLSGTNNIYDKYTRVLTVSNVQRDSNGNIVTSGGTFDANTKKVVSTVSWNVNSARTNSVTLTTYLTNWKADISTPAPTACNEYCISLGNYTQGTCRNGASQCRAYGETVENDGNHFCTREEGGTCCCLP